MTNWMNSGLIRKLAASLLAICLAGLAVPAQAYLMTQLTDGSYEYFFATPSLALHSTGDIDLGGVSFIEGVDGGFRVGATFALDWRGGEQAWQTPDIVWNGIDLSPRSLSIDSEGVLDLGATRLTLIGGTISLTAEAILIGSGAMIDVGGGNIIVDSNPGLPDRPPRPALPVGGGSLIVLPGGDISLSGPRPVTAIPEPSSWALLGAGLLMLAAVTRRRRMQ